MKILLAGEASYLHNTLKKGLTERGHRVTLMSDGNGWHDSPRDIDLRRDMSLGRRGGLRVLSALLRNLPALTGNDVVQIHNYQYVPLGMRWNELMTSFLKRHNRCLVKGCYGDDPQVIEMQLRGTPAYSDCFWQGRQQNLDSTDNLARIAEQLLPECVSCWRKASEAADALVPCLYEYYLCYADGPYRPKLRYIGLPMELPSSGVRVKGTGGTLRVLVGVQPDRDYLKGAMRIARLLERLSAERPGRLKIVYARNVPYTEYCRMLAEADVLVDQLYSYTPSMNALAAMARGTVVIGGGEEDYYSFIGERRLRPIINVSPDLSDDDNTAALRRALFTEGGVERLSRQSIDFVRKYHDYRKVAEQYERMYEEILGN